MAITCLDILQRSPVARVAVTLEGLTPLWLPHPIYDSEGRHVLPHRPLVVDWMNRLKYGGLMPAACCEPDDLFGGMAWNFLQISPTLIPIKRRKVESLNTEILYRDWSVAFDLLLPLGLVSIDTPALRAEVGTDIALYAARVFAEVGRTKGYARAGADYGTYTIANWRVKERRPMTWVRTTWV